MSALRLSELGSDPESVLRLVRFFDDLDATGADAVLEAAQAVAGCPVHVRWDGSAPEVWLERDAPAHPLDGVLLDRVRHALGDIGARVPPSFGDPALVEVVLSSRERPEDRARAIRLLGLDESREVRVLAVSAQSSPEALRVITSALTSVSVRTADLGTATAVVCQGRTKRHRQVLGIVLEHMKAEAVPDMDRLMATLSPNPDYHFWYANTDMGPKTTEGVRAYYEAFVTSGANHLVFEIDRLAVDDDLVMTEGWMKMIYPGAAAQAIGVDVDDPAGDYLLVFRQLINWPIDADGLIIGEDAYQTGPVSVTKLGAADLPQAYIDQKNAAAANA